MARRSRGEGNVRQRADGHWEGSVQVDGRRHWVTGKTRQEAAERLQELQRAKAGGALVAPAKLTVSDFLTQWLASAETTRKPSSYHNLESVVRVHLVPGIGDVRLQKLSPLTIARLYRDKSAGGLSARRVQIIHETLRAALNDAMRWRLIPHNPAAGVKPPRQMPKARTVWTREQTRFFVATARDEDSPYAWALVLLLALGLRENELAGLTWDALDLGAGVAHIARGVVHVAGKPIWSDLKTASSRRSLAVSALAREMLGKLRRWQVAARLRAGDAWGNPEGRVLCTSTGGIATPNVLLKTLRHLCEGAGAPRLTVHGLRHQAASLLLSDGASIKDVQQQLGHSRPSTTLNVYSHSIPGAGDGIAAKMDMLLTGTDGARK